MLSPDPLLFPTLSPDVQVWIRVAYGVLQALTLIAALPHARRYFLSERWGGYAQSRLSIDAVQNPVVGAAVLVMWLSAAVSLAAGRAVLMAAAVNVVLCYYFFIRMRWSGVLRGMGAPGFIAFWLGAAVFMLELTARRAPALRGLALLTLQVDFALIMLSAGIYKMVSGYRAGDGMELGMVNPEWGYWSSFWSGWSPRHPLFRAFNEMAWGTEVVAGVLMLVPATRPLGGLAMALSFVFIATQIRLGFLCEMVIVCCLLFVPAAGGGAIPAGRLLPAGAQQVIAACLWIYLALLPVVRIGMYYNQLAHRALPGPLQRGLDLYTNTFGLIIWRVFTADVVNFFVRVWEERRPDARRLLSNFSGFTWTHRFRQVAECITLTSVFTTLKYYPTNRAMFVDRLLRYARTIPHAADAQLVFEWVNVTKRADRFIFVPVAEYCVDVRRGTVDDTIVSDIVSVKAPAAASPVHEGVRPGSYVPMKR